MAAKKKYKWSGEKVARHSRPERGAPKAKTNKPKAKGGGGFEAGLKRRTTEASRNRYIQKAAGRRTTDASRQQFLKSHKLRDPDLDDPGYFTRPQTLGQANIEADRAANLRYGEEERGISNERDLVYRQGREIPAWFDQYRQNISQAQGAAAAMAQPVINQAQQTAQAVGQSTLAPGQATTAGGPQAAAEVGQRDQLAAASRNALAQSFASLLQTNQQATNNYFAGRQGVAGSAQIGAMGDNAMAKRQVEAKRTGIAAEKGDYRAGKLAETRDKERQYGLERSAFGLDVQKAEAEATQKKSDAASKRAADRRNRQQERRKHRADQRKYGQQRADALAKERARQRDKDEDQALARQKAAKGGGSGGSDGLTPLQRRGVKEKSHKAIERITTARGLWGDYAKQKNPQGKSPTPSQIKARLRKEGYSSSEIHLMLVHRGGKRWSPSDRKLARRLGIRIRDL